jgi:hypothetical protein
MNTRILIASLTAASLAGLLGCSTPQAIAPAVVYELPPLPSPDYEIRDGQLVPKAGHPAGRFCQLGTSCLTMDPRPFEPCLVSTKKCSDKAAEPMLVAPPKSIAPAPSVILY